MVLTKRVAGRAVGGALAGLGGALLTAYGPFPMRISVESAPSPLDGIWFGIAMAGYFSVVGTASRMRAAGIVVLSSVAYPAAFCTAMLSGLALFAIHAVSLAASAFLAGAVGGVLLSIATTFRLYEPDVSARGIRTTCAIAGGILGLAAVRLAVVPNSWPLQFSTPVLCLVWQTGMGLILGVSSRESD